MTPVSRRGVDGLQGPLLQIDIAKIIVHEGDEPNAVFDFLEADPLTGEDDREIDLLFVQADAPSSSDH